MFYSVVRFAYRVLRTLVGLVRLPFHKDYFIAECYFPEYISRRKSGVRRFFDQVVYTFKHGEPNKFYFLYGMDIKNFHDPNEYIDNYTFMRRRSIMDKVEKFPPIAVLRDKSLFGIVADAYGINTPKNIGIVENGNIYVFSEKKHYAFRHWVKGKSFDAFLKRIDGECGEGIYHVVYKNGLSEKDLQVDIIQTVETGTWLLQTSITNQHHDIAALFPKSINTLRLVTVRNERTNRIEVFSCVLRVGKGANVVDNWAAGGLSIGVDTDKGQLREYGYYKPGFGTKATEHPDTHVIFKDYKIPFMQESIAMAKEFHERLHGMHSIGWDIAITEDGPCFVEGNDNWEISLMQISNHGLQKAFKDLFY